MSDVAKRIDAVIRDGLASLMKREGFKKSGRDFSKTDSESVAILNVQASQSNFGANGKFTINLGRYFPSVAQVVGGPQPQGVPKEYHSTIRRRIGQFLPGNLDQWWSVAPETDTAKLGAEVARVVEEVGLPWFRRVHDLPSLQTELGGFPSIELASVLLLLGDKDRAEGCLREFVQARPMARAHANAWARRNGINAA